MDYDRKKDGRVAGLPSGIGRVSGSWVYFAGRIGGPIKIGVTTNLDRRRAGLQIGNPDTIEILASMPGDRAIEGMLKARFAAANIRGEWFNPVPELLALLWTAAGDPTFYLQPVGGEQVGDDGIERFLADRVVFQANARIRSMDLHSAFEAWAEAAGERDWAPIRRFATALHLRGFRKVRSNGMWWLGLRLRDAKDGE